MKIKQVGLLLVIAASICAVSLISYYAPTVGLGGAAALVKRAARASLSVNYSATESMIIVIGKESQHQTFSTVHLAPDKTMWKYKSSKGDIEWIVSDNGKSHWQYLPNQNEIIYSPSHPTDRNLWAEHDLGQLLRNYIVKNAGKSRLSGRNTYLLTISPRSAHNGPSKKLWSDTETGLIMRSELTTSDGMTKVVSDLTDIKFNCKVPASGFAFPGSTSRRTVVYDQVVTIPLDELAHQWQLPLLVPKQIPNGYTLESAMLINRGNRAYVHLRYFDGLNTISLFEEPSKDVNDSPVVWQFRAPYRSAIWRTQGTKLTLISDLSRMTLLEIAKSVSVYQK